MKKDLIIGINPVLEALKAGRTINKIMITRGKRKKFGRILTIAAKKKIPVLEVDDAKLDKITVGKNHQGIVAEASAKQYLDFDELLVKCKNRTDPFLLLLDGLEDPRNLGAIIRTAEAVGCDGIVIPKRRSVALNQTVAKTSAGAIEYVPVSRVPNLAMAIEKMKEENFWIVGCEAVSDNTIYNIDLKGPIAAVVGGEGKGISRLVAEKCDFLAKIPMRGKLNSLNASVAASVVMYEVLRQRLHT